MQRRCACGKPIKGKVHLCVACLEIYGSDRAEWPEWLKFMVNDLEREYASDRRADNFEITFTDLGVY